MRASTRTSARAPNHEVAKGSIDHALRFSGAPDRRWDNDDLHTLDRLTGHDFEVVDTQSLRRRG